MTTETPALTHDMAARGRAAELRALLDKPYKYIDRKWDIMFWVTAAFVVGAAADITKQLFAGDWDFWTDWKDIQWADRAHFFAMAANMMRRVLVDHARRRDRAKRGGEAIHVSLVEAAHVPAPERADVLALDEALQRLETIDPRKSRIVEMRFFGGLSLEETAEALDVSVATVRRDWSLARAWLARELKRA